MFTCKCFNKLVTWRLHVNVSQHYVGPILSKFILHY